MKLLPQNKTRSLWSLVALILAVVGIVYLNFFYQESPSAVPEVALEQAATSSLPLFSGELLPYGEKLDLSILESESFKALKLAPAVKISETELGKDNLFTR